MGTPSYATLHMGWWEEQVLKVEYATERKENIVVWSRYIDHLFILWKGPQETADRSVSALNENSLN